MVLFKVSLAYTILCSGVLWSDVPEEPLRTSTAKEGRACANGKEERRTRGRGAELRKFRREDELSRRSWQPQLHSPPSPHLQSLPQPQPQSQSQFLDDDKDDDTESDSDGRVAAGTKYESPKLNVRSRSSSIIIEKAEKVWGIFSAIVTGKQHQFEYGWQNKEQTKKGE